MSLINQRNDLGGPSLMLGMQPSLKDKLTGVYQAMERKFRDVSSHAVTFTGASEDAGSSTLAVAFASTVAAQLDRNVALLMSDDSTLESLGLSVGRSRHTLSDVAQEKCQLSDAIAATAVENLGCARLAPEGVPVASLSSSPSFEATVTALRQNFDLLIFDAPPFSSSVDALLLASRSDGVVLVVEADKTRWQVAENIKERMQEQGSEILGVILNKRKFYIPRRIYTKL